MIKDLNLIKYSNKVVRSAQRLSLLEQRIVFSAIAKTPADQQITSEDVFTCALRNYVDWEEPYLTTRINNSKMPQSTSCVG